MSNALAEDIGIGAEGIACFEMLFAEVWMSQEDVEKRRKEERNEQGEAEEEELALELEAIVSLKPLPSPADGDCADRVFVLNRGKQRE